MSAATDAGRARGVPQWGRALVRRDGRRGWRIATAAVATFVLVPVALVAASALSPSVEVWRFLWGAGLAHMVMTTVVLMAGVVVGALVIGAGLAWLVATYRFPGRGVFSWLLVLPLAVPSYVLAFVTVSLLDAPGPLQTLLRESLGVPVAFAAPQGLVMAVAVMSLALYPYVYLLARAALTEQAAATYAAARTLGHGPVRAARRVVLPMARPSLAAAGALVAMETLTDFATIQYFNVETVSVAVYQVWNGMFDRAAATELASLVLVFAVGIVVAERALRGRARYHQRSGAAGEWTATTLTGWRAAAATGVCALVVGVAFIAPAVRLGTWALGALRDGGLLDARYLGYLGNSALVAGVVAVACVALATIVVNATRLSPDPATRGLARLTGIGYAVPGPVVAIGMLLVLAGLDTLADAAGADWGTTLVTGSVVGIVLAYLVRFLALATNGMEASLDKVTPSLTMSAVTLGATPLRAVTRVHLPLMRSGIGVALLFVAVDALKELPIVLLLRPFGFSTLAVWVYESASESRWELVGLPALTIVAAALVPVLLLLRGTLHTVEPLHHVDPAVATDEPAREPAPPGGIR